MSRYWMILALLSLSVLGTGCGSREVAAAPGQGPTPVRVYRVQQTSFSDESRYTATLEPITQLDLAFRTSGQVETLYLTRGRPLEPGDEVAAGSVLARLRRTEFEARTKSAEAQLADARATRASGAAQILEAEEGVTLANQDLRRAERLYEGQAMTRAELDSVRARANSSQSRLVAAKAAADGFDARIRASHAAMEESRVPLADTVLTAPFTAVVVARHIERGSTVGAGTVAYTLADLRQMKVRFGVPDVALRGLPTGSPMRMNVESVPGQSYLARVIGAAPSADPATRLFPVQALAPNPRGLLKAGMVASIVADSPGQKSIPAVPLRSIRRLGEPNRFAVLTVEGDVLHLREVTLGPAQSSLIGINTGLRPGELVVDDAGTGLRAGDKVRTIPQSDTQ